MRHIAPTGHPVKTNEGHEEGTIFIFMRGTDAEERHRRSAHGSIGNFRPETPKYAILVHSLLVGLDADKYDATEYELELVRGGSCASTFFALTLGVSLSPSLIQTCPAS